MRTRRPPLWIPRLLFGLTVGLGTVLLALVILCPLLAGPGVPDSGWPRLAGLFARDAIVRHTSVASGLGLLATAWIFFRPAVRVPVLQRKPRLPRHVRPPTAAGA
jgi:hypothetical protein